MGRCYDSSYVEYKKGKHDFTIWIINYKTLGVFGFNLDEEELEIKH